MQAYTHHFSQTATKYINLNNLFEFFLLSRVSKREKEKKTEFEHIEGREQKMREKEHTQTHTHTQKKRFITNFFFRNKFGT